MGAFVSFLFFSFFYFPLDLSPSNALYSSLKLLYFSLRVLKACFQSSGISFFFFFFSSSRSFTNSICLFSSCILITFSWCNLCNVSNSLPSSSRKTTSIYLLSLGLHNKQLISPQRFPLLQNSNKESSKDKNFY